MRVRHSYGAILVLALLASGQRNPAIPSLGETIEVSLVNLDVFVTNKAGQRVTGLTKDDFLILENGVSQPISNFSEFVSDKVAAPATTQMAKPVQVTMRQPRTIVVFVERFFLPPQYTEPFFSSLKKMLHESVKPGDRVEIVTWNRGILLTQQPFTDRLALLDHAVDGVAKLSSQRMSDIRAEMRWQLAIAEEIGGNNVSGVGETIADMERDQIAMIEKISQQQKVKAIDALMRSIAANEGKKIFVLVTHRLSRVAGLDAFSGAAQEKNINYFDQGERRAAADMSAALKTIDDTANANGITIYPLFPEGLENTVTDASESAAVPVVDYQTLNNEMHALTELAQETGGQTAWGSDTTKLIPQITEDLDTYYSLAYRIQGTNKDRARKIVVKTKDPSLVVRVRREFVDKSDQTKMEDRVIAALFKNPPSPGFGLKVDVGMLRVQGTKTIIPLRIHIPLAAMTQIPDGRQHSGAYSVYFAWGGMLGGIGDSAHFTQTYSVPSSEIEKARASGAYTTFEKVLSVDKNTDNVAFGVVDEVGKDYALRLMPVPRPPKRK